MLVGKPYKGNLHSLAIGHLLYEHLFLQAVGLAYLSLHAVAINGQRLALVPTEEFLYQFLADDSLLFLETCWSRHYIIYILR